jgi:hypothetical protein
MMHAPSRVHGLLSDAGDVRVGASLALSAAATQAPARQPFLLGPSQSQGLGFGALHAFEHGSPFGSDPLRAILTLNEAVRKDVQSGHARGQSLGALGPLRPLVARIATCG